MKTYMKANTMLEHQKIILKNVIDDRELFLKELKKSMTWLEEDDIKKLYIWLRANFWSSHRDTLQLIFKKVTTK
jgi:hypothetical protein